MNANVVEFPHKPPPVERLAQFVRVGETSYQRVCSLFTEGHLKTSRVVIDASRVKHLKQPMAAFSAFRPLKKGRVENNDEYCSININHP